MARIDINKDEREADRVIQQAVASTVVVGDAVVTVTKEQKSLVFKALTDLKNKKRNDNGYILMKDLRNHILISTLSDAALHQALQELDGSSNIHYVPNEARIYPWFPYLILLYQEYAQISVSFAQTLLKGFQSLVRQASRLDVIVQSNAALQVVDDVS